VTTAETMHRLVLHEVANSISESPVGVPGRAGPGEVTACFELIFSSTPEGWVP